jgi:hypothetical protein
MGIQAAVGRRYIKKICVGVREDPQNTSLGDELVTCLFLQRSLGESRKIFPVVCATTTPFLAKAPMMRKNKLLSTIAMLTLNPYMFIPLGLC